MLVTLRGQKYIPLPGSHNDYAYFSTVLSLNFELRVMITLYAVYIVARRHSFAQRK